MEKSGGSLSLTLATEITDTMQKMEHYNNFLGLNMGNSPSYTVHEAICSRRMADGCCRSGNSGSVCFNPVAER